MLHLQECNKYIYMLTFLKKEIEDEGFQTTVPTEGLLVVENFLSQKEIDSFLNLIDTTEEKEWHKMYLDGLKPFCLEKFGRDDVENLVAEGKYEITVGWEDKNLRINEYPFAQAISEKLDALVKLADKSLELNGFSMQRMQTGVQLKSHTDQHTDPSIRYASIIYINDNYNGGEVNFKNKGISLKPKPGTLLIFPGTEEFEHGVEFVLDGPIRYVLPGFIKVKDFYKDNKY